MLTLVKKSEWDKYENWLTKLTVDDPKVINIAGSLITGVKFEDGRLAFTKDDEIVDKSEIDELYDKLF